MRGATGSRGLMIPLTILGLLLLVCRTASGQAEPLRIGLTEPRPVATSGAPDEADERLIRLLEEAFSSELQALGFAVAEPLAAPVRFDVRYLRSGARLTLLVTASDSESAALLGGGTFVGTADLALVNTVRQAAAEVAAQLRAAAAVDGTRPDTPVVLLRMTLRSPDEGAGIYLTDDARIGFIEDGMLELPFVPVALGSALVIEQRLDGYFSETRSIPITGEYMEVELAGLRPRIDWELSASWMTQRPAGAAVGLRRYLVPEMAYVQGTAQLASRYRFSAGSRASALVDTRLSLGLDVLSLAQRRLRLGFASGFGVTLSLLGAEETAYFFADPYLNVLSIALRWQLERFAPFLQADFVYYGDASTGHLNRGTHPYVSAGVLLPWRP